jgi:hypothetical protein
MTASDFVSAAIQHIGMATSSNADQLMVEDFAGETRSAQSLLAEATSESDHST